MIDSGTVPDQLQLDSLPEDPAYLANLGDKYFESNRFEQAIEIYKKAIELNPNDVDTINDLGLAYFYTKNTDEAVSTLRTGTEVNPSFQRIWLSLGYVLMSSGKNEEARQALQKTINLAPDSGVGQEASRMMGLLNNPR
jgi:tetratricopeptide (TPR) repeat protein